MTARQFSDDPLVNAVIMAESSGRQNALSPKGARGLMQLMPATARDLERLAAGSVIATGTHVVRMPYHAGVTTQTVVTFNGRRLAVTGVSNPDERNRETICVCAEVVD